jgi:protein-S-isoprenylcysteine O-methyltransferase Ste14
MMTRQDCSGQVVEVAAVAFAAVALAVSLRLVMTIADHRITRTSRAARAIGPTMLTDQFVALGVIDKRGEVDQLWDSHDDTESVRN